MRLTELIAEAWRSGRARLAPSLAIALLAGAMCLTSLLTVGRTAAAEATLQDRLATAGSRLLIVTDQRQQQLLPTAIVSGTGALDSVERAVGLTTPVDVTAGHVGAGGIRVPAWAVLGPLDAVAELTSGRWPRPGELVVSSAAQTQLGLPGAYGYVTTGQQEYAIVGTYQTRAPFGQLAAGAIGPASPGDTAASLHVVVSNAGQAAATQTAVIALIDPPRAQDLQVQSPLALASLEEQLGGDLGRYGDQILILTVTGGVGLIAAIVLVDVLMRRSDLGRRRALGATRSTIIGLTIVRTLLAAAIGCLVGVATGFTISARAGEALPPAFAASVTVLAILAAAVGALAPAILAANQDPVRALRTP